MLTSSGQEPPLEAKLLDSGPLEEEKLTTSTPITDIQRKETFYGVGKIYDPSFFMPSPTNKEPVTTTATATAASTSAKVSVPVAAANVLSHTLA